MIQDPLKGLLATNGFKKPQIFGVLQSVFEFNLNLKSNKKFGAKSQRGVFDQGLTPFWPLSCSYVATSSTFRS